MNIYYHIVPFDETEEAADFIMKYSGYKRCKKLEAIKYICAEHEYLNEVGFNIYSNESSYSDSFSFYEMLEYISDIAKLSKRKTRLFRKAEKMYLESKGRHRVSFNVC